MRNRLRRSAFVAATLFIGLGGPPSAMAGTTEYAPLIGVAQDGSFSFTSAGAARSAPAAGGGASLVFGDGADAGIYTFECEEVVEQRDGSFSFYARGIHVAGGGSGHTYLRVDVIDTEAVAGWTMAGISDVATSLDHCGAGGTQSELSTYLVRPLGMPAPGA